MDFMIIFAVHNNETNFFLQNNNNKFAFNDFIVTFVYSYIKHCIPKPNI